LEEPVKEPTRYQPLSDARSWDAGPRVKRQVARDRQGSSNVACAAASLRLMLTGGRADHGSHRGYWDRPARPKLGVWPAAPSHGEPRGGASPARPWRYTAGGVAGAAPGLLRCGLPPPRRGLIEERRDRLVNRQPATGGAGCRLGDVPARRGAGAPARLVQYERTGKGLHHAKDSRTKADSTGGLG
jgi:hypothetical protein